MTTFKAFSVVFLATLSTGCATKHYEHLQSLSAVDEASYDCPKIALELSKVSAFNDQVRHEARFNGKSVLGILGDYGVGNALAKGAAEKSSTRRRLQLQALSAQKGCAAQDAAPAAAKLSAS